MPRSQRIAGAGLPHGIGLGLRWEFLEDAWEPGYSPEPRTDPCAECPDTWEEAMRGLVDFGRIEEMLDRTKGRIDHVVTREGEPLVYLSGRYGAMAPLGG